MSKLEAYKFINVEKKLSTSQFLQIIQFNKKNLKKKGKRKKKKEKGSKSMNCKSAM